MTLRIEDLVDVSTFPPGEDGSVTFDLTGQRITGARVVLEWVLRAWLTPRGVLRNTAKGIDLRGLENVTVGPGDLDRWRAACVAEAEAVEYVHSCAVSVTLEGRTSVIAADVTLINGKSYPLAVTLAEALFVSFGGTT